MGVADDVRANLSKAMCLLLGITVATILSMVRLKLANICFPAEVLAVNE